MKSSAILYSLYSISMSLKSVFILRRLLHFYHSYIFILIFFIDVNSLTNLQCNQILCLTQPVQYQCIVTDSPILRWRVRNETSVSLSTRTYSDGDILLPTTPLTNVPNFSADLSSIDPLISNILFIVQSCINGYSVHCEDGNGADTNCTINIEGESFVSYCCFVWPNSKRFVRMFCPILLYNKIIIISDSNVVIICVYSHLPFYYLLRSSFPSC